MIIVVSFSHNFFRCPNFVLVSVLSICADILSHSNYPGSTALLWLLACYVLWSSIAGFFVARRKLDYRLTLRRDSSNYSNSRKQDSMTCSVATASIFFSCEAMRLIIWRINPWDFLRTYWNTSLLFFLTCHHLSVTPQMLTSNSPLECKSSLLLVYSFSALSFELFWLYDKDCKSASQVIQNLKNNVRTTKIMNIQSRCHSRSSYSCWTSANLRNFGRKQIYVISGRNKSTELRAERLVTCRERYICKYLHFGEHKFLSPDRELQAALL